MYLWGGRLQEDAHMISMSLLSNIILLFTFGRELASEDATSHDSESCTFITIYVIFLPVCLFHPVRLLVFRKLSPLYGYSILYGYLILKGSPRICDLLYS